MGNGQYYDPTTGRFLTRDAKPNNSNPYVPSDPTGAIIAPLGMAALFFGRKKKGNKLATFLILLVVVGAVGMTLAACGNNNQSGSSPTSQVTVIFVGTNNYIATQNGSVIATATALPEGPNIKVTVTAQPTSCATVETLIATVTSTPMPTTPGGGSNPQNMETSEKGKIFIKYWEEDEYAPYPYEDMGGYCTIGWGHLLKKDGCSGWPNKTWYYDKKDPHPLSETEAENWFDGDVNYAEDAVRETVTAGLTQAQFDALVSYIFNVGKDKYNIEKKIPELINSGNYNAAAAAIQGGPITSGGLESNTLIERRQAEANLFLNGVYVP